MNKYPLLLFDNPLVTTRTKLSNKWNRSILNIPMFEKQVERLGPVFSNLQNALINHRLSPQTSTLGLEPECTVVMEIRGSLENFISITKNTEGLEWLAEFNEEVEADEDFYNKDENGTKLDSRIKNKLFVTMANQRAIDELIRCWNLYSKDPDVKFDRGKGKLKDIFKNLYTIRRWNLQDRLEGSYLLENWQFKKDNGCTDLSLEIELWYRRDYRKRQHSQNVIKLEIEKLGGKILNCCDIPEIKYHAILASVPANVFDSLKNNEEISLLKCEEVMYFNPTAQAVSELDIKNAEDCDVSIETEQHSFNPKCHVAVFDTVPIANNSFLRNSLNVNDVDDLAETTFVSQRAHGTAVCSLILNGDLSRQDTKLKNKIYVRPILNNYGIPEGELPVDITFRAVKEILDDKELKDNIKIVNLSVGDYYRQFNKNISAWARLIDYFSYRYNLLFCISTGNYSDPIELDCTLSEWNSLSLDEKNKKILCNMRNTDVFRKILAPSEAINAITVGAIHDDWSNFSGDPNRLELVQSSVLPSTITRFGLGFRNSVKPEICVEAGRQLYEKPLLDSHKLENIRIKDIQTKAPGLCVAYDSNKIAFVAGTSFACALATRAAAQFYEVLEEIATTPSQISVLLKAMLVHSCTWNNFEDFIGQTLERPTWQLKKRLTSKMIGYGKANFQKMLNCSPQRVIAVALNSIKKDSVHEYRFPLPSSLTGPKHWLRLTMTLAWFSPINNESAKYRRAKLWLENESEGIFSSIISNSKKDIDADASTKGTVQHLVFESEKALAYVEGTDVVIKVNCLSEDGRDIGYINYGLVVSLEVKAENTIDIYEEVAERIIIREKVQTRV